MSSRRCLPDIDTTSGAVGEDQDGDFFDDGDEHAAGTDPGDPQSLLAVHAISRAANNELVLDWYGVSGRRYNVHSAASTDETNWVLVAANVATNRVQVAVQEDQTVFRVAVTP